MIDENYYIDKLNKYLPPFILESEVKDALLKSISKRLLELHHEIYDLPNANWTGKGLTLDAQENKIYYNDRRLCLSNPDGQPLLLPDGVTQIIIRFEDLGTTSIEAVELPDGQTVLLMPDGITYLSISETYSEKPIIQSRLENRLQYWKARGTEGGIQADLEAMFGLNSSTLVFHPETETGMIGDVTAFDDNNFVDADRLIEFIPSDRGYIDHRAGDDLIIRKNIIPIDAEIFFNEN